MKIITQNVEVSAGDSPQKDVDGKIELTVAEVQNAVALYVKAKHGLEIPADKVTFDLGQDRDESSWLEGASAPVKVRITQVLGVPKS